MNDTAAIRLAMFDLDGTLFDTERANYLAYKEACGGRFPLTEDYFHEKCISRSYKEFLPELGVPEELLHEIHSKKIQCYRSFFSEIRINEPLFCIARLLRGGGASLSVVTTASRTNALELMRFFRCEELFDLIVTQETVTNLKPSPDAYLYAMRYFKAAPCECIIFEDSPTGLAAAKATGAAVCRIDQF